MFVQIIPAQLFNALLLLLMLAKKKHIIKMVSMLAFTIWVFEFNIGTKIVVYMTKIAQYNAPVNETV